MEIPVKGIARGDEDDFDAVALVLSKQDVILRRVVCATMDTQLGSLRKL
jgi:hypothetical protein